MTTTSPTPTTTAAPVEEGASACVDDSVVQDAIASLTPFMASAWQLDEQGDPCATLAWATARTEYATASSPDTVLFFHDNTYLGTATAKPYAFTTVVEQLPDTVVVSYKWLGPDDPNANPTGGPALVRYQWNGSSVDMLDELPTEVLNPPDPNPAPTPAPGPDPGTGLRCVDTATLNAAIATLPPFEGRGWVDSSRTDACLPLAIYLTRPDGRNMTDDPQHLLFFHDGQYLGRANDAPYPFMGIAETGSDFVTIAYSWKVAGDDTFSASGGPSLVRYQLNGSSVETIGTVPVEVTG